MFWGKWRRGSDDEWQWIFDSNRWHGFNNLEGKVAKLVFFESSLKFLIIISLRSQIQSKTREEDKLKGQRVCLPSNIYSKIVFKLPRIHTLIKTFTTKKEKQKKTSSYMSHRKNAIDRLGRRLTNKKTLRKDEKHQASPLCKKQKEKNDKY